MSASVASVLKGKHCDGGDRFRTAALARRNLIEPIARAERSDNQNARTIRSAAFVLLDFAYQIFGTRDGGKTEVDPT